MSEYKGSSQEKADKRYREKVKSDAELKKQRSRQSAFRTAKSFIRNHATEEDGEEIVEVLLGKNLIKELPYPETTLKELEDLLQQASDFIKSNDSSNIRTALTLHEQINNKLNILIDRRKETMNFAQNELALNGESLVVHLDREAENVMLDSIKMLGELLKFTYPSSETKVENKK